MGQLYGARRAQPRLIPAHAPKICLENGHLWDSRKRSTSRMSNTGQSVAVSPEHCAIVFAKRRSSLLRSAILARMCSRLCMAILRTSAHVALLRRDRIATILQNSCCWRGFAHGMATIHCKENGPDLWGWGAEEETRAMLILERAQIAYHPPPPTKNDHLVTARLPAAAAIFAFATALRRRALDLSS